MKRSICTGLVVVAGFACLASGQSSVEPVKPTARVIDEMERPGCERIQAAMDAAQTEMMNNPADQLFAIVHPGMGEKRFANGYGANIAGWIRWRRFDPSRVTIAFGAEREVAKVILIGVPPGAEQPKTERPWFRSSLFADAEIPARAKLIVTETEDENPCVSNNRALEDLGDFLKDNPKARARIVVKISTASEFNEEAKSIKETLSTDYEVAPGRVRIIHVKTRPWPVGPMKETEYWLLPKAPR